MSLLLVENLGIEFGSESAPLVAVHDVNFTVEPGEVLGLVGESGSGKSLTCRAILKLIGYPGRISSGRVVFEGREVLAMTPGELRSYRAHDAGMIFQDPFSSLNPVYRVGTQVVETLRLNVGLDRSQARETALELFAQVGLPNPERQFLSYPHELSGGMRQRVMIAIATASKPRLLLADEPTTALDVMTQKQILNLLDRMRREIGMAMLLVSHDFGVIAQMCDRVLVMYGGSIVESGLAEKIYENPQHPYTRALLESVPELDAFERLQRHQPLPGQPPELGPRRLGCVFAHRCPHARAACRSISMKLEAVGTGHFSACPFETTNSPSETIDDSEAVGK